jgi:uncharacterized protein YodC (DUF2158 family)
MGTTFSVGEVVRLKSGGEKMTVGKLEPESSPTKTHAFCGWFEGKKLQQRTFPLEMLERAQD